MADDLVLEHLRGLDQAGLSALLRLRPGSAHAPVPSTLAELAQRLSSAQSVEAALQTLPAAALDLLAVLQYLGAGASRSTVRELVALHGPADEAALDRQLASLHERALVIEGADSLQPVPYLRTVFANPLGRGLPIADLLSALPAAWTDLILRSLHVKAPRDQASARAAVAHALDPGRVRHLLQTAPQPALAGLEELLGEGGMVEVDGFGPYTLVPGSWRSPSRLNFLLDHGLAAHTLDGYVVASRELLDVVLERPRHLVLPLHRPGIDTVPADDVPVRRESAAAATSLLALVTELLEELAARPCPTLKTGLGGLGVREVRRLAKLFGCTEQALGLAARLADLAGLARAVDEVQVTPAYSSWREQDPPDRLVALLTAWWAEPGPVTAEPTVWQRTSRSRPLPLFVRPEPDPAVRRLRHSVLEALAALPAGRGMLDAASLQAHVRWECPLGLPSEVEGDLARHLEAVLVELAGLGLVAHGRASALGQALATGDTEALRAASAEALPAVAHDVLLQADLTAVVTGSPSAAITALLDAMADREARGNASTWRFGPASVRRALDTGARAEDLLARLAAAARAGVPQPLTYLVHDVARRHGHLAVAPVTCVVVAEDPALLAEVVAHRSLRPLAARLLAPTVLASAAPVPETLRLLRAAGYLPVEHDAGGALVLTGRPRSAATAAQTSRGKQPPAPRRSPSKARDVDALAAALLAAPEQSPPAKKPAEAAPKARPASAGRAPTAPVDDAPDFLTYCGHLSDDEVGLLVEAEATGGEIVIDYVDQRGRWTERVVSDCVLDPPYLEAWCHLRDDEREFLLQSVQSVRRVS